MRGFNIRSKESRLRQKPYPGMVVASQQALYFVVDAQMTLNLAGGVLKQFGALGGLLEGLIQGGKKFKGSLLPKVDPLVKEMDKNELPDIITNHPDWPVNFQKGWVLVVPSEAVLSMRSSCILGGIKVELQDAFILIFTPIFQRKQMATTLIGMGWKVEGA